MSHVDSYKHKIVGLFGSIPVYRPLEVIDGDFKAHPGQLILGGGSGEHPSMVVEKPEQAVALFLRHKLQPLKDPKLKGDYYPLKKMIDVWEPAIEPFLPGSPEAVLQFYDWATKDFEQFEKLCISPAMPNPYWRGNFTEWLVLSFGEFIFFSMPKLAPEVMGKLGENPYQHFRHIHYNNIGLIPPNMPVYANGGNAFQCRLEQG